MRGDLGGRSARLFLAFLGWALLLLTQPGKAQETVLKPEDFAYTIPIEASPGASHLRVNVPLVLYQRVVRTDLGDVRVFNAAGEVVPHALITSPETRTRTECIRSLPFFPLRTQGQKQGVEGLEIVARKGPSGTILEVRDQGDVAAPERLVGYILDTGELERPPDALLLDWEVRENSFLGRVQVDGSDDLKSWRTLSASAPIARLADGAQTLEERRVRLEGAKGRFLRLAWPEDQAELVLTGVSAVLINETRHLERSWIAAVPTGVSDNPGEYGFDLGARAAVDRLRLGLPEPNTLVAVSIASRPNNKAAWRAVAGGMLYRLNRGNGSELLSPDIEIPPNTDGYWLVRVDPRGGGIGDGELGLSAAYAPQQIVFVARGEGPFQVAMGSAIATPATFPIGSLVPGYTDEGLAKIPLAETGPLRIAGGEERLMPPRPPVSWQRLLLWVALSLAVGVLGWMARGLLRQTAAQRSP